MTKRVAKLIMVTPENNNKFYDMVENDDGSISIDFGRVGVTSTKMTYPVGKKKWESLYNEKTKKGYVDQTSNRLVTTAPIELNEISNSNVSAFVNTLQKYAKQSVEANYVVSSNVVTQSQVESAQKILDQIAKDARLNVYAKKVNDGLLELYRVIPRRMKNVKDHLIAEQRVCSSNLEAINKMIANEQATLDVMRGQVVTHLAAKNRTSPGTVLDALGLHIIPASENDYAQFRRMLGPDAHRLRRAFRVLNDDRNHLFSSWSRKAPNPKTELLFHGSRNENWWNICKTGLLIRPANAVITGAMFGYGIYAASLARKSIGYTSLRNSYWANGNSDTGYLGVFNFHLGTMYETSEHRSWMCSLDYKKLREMGTFDSLHAKAGRSLINDEFIVYNEAQVDIYGIIEIGG